MNRQAAQITRDAPGVAHPQKVQLSDPTSIGSHLEIPRQRTPDLSELKTVKVEHIRAILELANKIDAGTPIEKSTSAAEITLRELLQKGTDIGISAGSIVQAIVTLSDDGEISFPDLNLSHLIKNKENTLRPYGLSGCRNVVEELSREVAVDNYIKLLALELAKPQIDLSTTPAFSVPLPKVGSAFQSYEFGLKQCLYIAFYPLLQFAHLVTTADGSRTFAGRVQNSSWALLGKPDPYSVKSPSLQKLMAYCIAHKIPFSARAEVYEAQECVIGKDDDCIWTLNLDQQTTTDDAELFEVDDDENDIVLELEDD